MQSFRARNRTASKGPFPRESLVKSSSGPLLERFCGCVEIGRQARLRIWCLCAYGFESLHPHEKAGVQLACFVFFDFSAFSLSFLSSFGLFRQAGLSAFRQSFSFSWQRVQKIAILCILCAHAPGIGPQNCFYPAACAENRHPAQSVCTRSGEQDHAVTKMMMPLIPM